MLFPFLFLFINYTKSFLTFELRLLERLFLRMDILIKKQLEQEFENYMFSFFNEFKRFSLEDFGSFAATLLNYYINNNRLPQSEKPEASYYLATLYNKGIGNRITEEHLQVISKAIADDSSIDFMVAQRLF